MKKNGLIVYYTLTGNTKVVAEEIQKKTGFDIQRIRETKERKQGNIMGSALGALLGLKSRIKPLDFSLENTESIFLGVQIWAGKTAPAINRYLSKVSLKQKKIWLFVTKADNKVPEKFINAITKRIEKKGGKVMGNISFTSPWKPNKNTDVISREKVCDSIDKWLVTKFSSMYKIKI